jgi:hypothetical protein
MLALGDPGESGRELSGHGGIVTAPYDKTASSRLR